MTDEMKPREWSLPIATLIVNSDFNRPNGTHVIEARAYYELQRKLEIAKRALDEISDYEPEEIVTASFGVLKGIAKDALKEIKKSDT